MKLDSLEEMRIFETYADNKILSDSYFCVRVDGRCFHTEVKKMKLKRPFDKILRKAIISASKEVMKDFNCVFAYTESDEVSFLFDKDTNLFDRRHEKISTLIAAKMTAEFNKTKLGRSLNFSPIFDARALVLPNKEAVIKNFQWRSMDSHRNCISTHCFWNLVDKKKLKPKNAQKALEGKKDSFKNELLFSEFGVNYNTIPSWERKGSMIYWKKVKKQGYNPIKKEIVLVDRRKLMDEPVRVHFKEDNLTKWINKGIKVI